jgi:hypothetical protein
LRRVIEHASEHDASQHLTRYCFCLTPKWLIFSVTVNCEVVGASSISISAVLMLFLALSLMLLLMLPMLLLVLLSLLLLPVPVAGQRTSSFLI